MLRALLEDRFTLRVHTETRNSDAYALVVARSGGRLGPRLMRSSTDCSKYADSVTPPDEPPPVASEICGFRVSTRNTSGVGIEIHLTVRGATIAQLADQLAPMAPVARAVLDRTGLGGGYDMDIAFSAGASVNGVPVDAGQTGSSIFTALQEQLGLKLEAITAPVEFLIIDSAEHPSPD